jgi:hypothetical protein
MTRTLATLLSVLVLRSGSAAFANAKWVRTLTLKSKAISVDPDRSFARATQHLETQAAALQKQLGAESHQISISNVTGKELILKKRKPISYSAGGTNYDEERLLHQTKVEAKVHFTVSGQPASGQ